jgi:hypothetical protein
LSFFEHHRSNKCIDEYVNEISLLKGYGGDDGGGGGDDDDNNNNNNN